jgi:acyl carrier protein
MTTIEEVQSAITEIVSRALKASLESDQTLVDVAAATEQLDSMAILEVLVGLEERFQIELIDEQLDAPKQCRDVRALARLVWDKLQAAER